MTKNLLFSFLFLVFSTTVFAQWPTYCTPTASNQAGYMCGVANISIGSLLNRSITLNFNTFNKFYYDSTNSAFKTTPGGTVNISQTNGSSSGTKASIFVDWNRDGVYANPAELVWQNSNTANNAVNTGNFTVPALQSPGAYRVRIVGDGSSYSPNPCNITLTGNFVDYTMIVTAPTATDGQILTLNTPSRFLTGNNTISLKMANTGTSNVTSLVIGYKYGNNAPVTQTISSLNVAGLYDATFSTPLNLTPGSDSLKVWIADINGNPSTTQGDDTLRFLVTTCNPLSGTYTIDPLGSGPNNFTTFTNAMNTLWCGGVTGPVTFNVAAGTYVEQISVQEIIGASATNTITINGGTGNAASRILSFNFPSGAASPNYSVFHLNGADYFRIKNITIRSTSTAVGYGILLNNQADYNIVDSCIINISNVTSTSSNNSAGICFSAANNNTTTSGNNGNFNTIQNNQILGAAAGCPFRGINFYGHGTSNTANSNQNNSFINNTITDFYESGIYTYGGLNTTITGNSISRPNRTISTTVYGIFTQYSNNTIVEGNRIFNPFGGQLNSTAQFYGIRHSYNYYGPNTFINNAIFNINGNGIHYGIYSEANYSWNAKYYNNTISLDNTTPKPNTNADYGIWLSFNTSSLLHDFKNNIITVRRSGSNATALRYGMFFNDYYANILSSNNNLIISNSAVGDNILVRFNSIDYKSLSAWKASNGNLFDQNSVTIDPVYANLVTDVTPTGCGMDNLGVSLADVLTDITGANRASTPDMGAYEFTTSTYANEGALTEFTSFTSTFCSGGIPAEVILKNFGTNNITSARIDWIVNGTPQTQYVWSGNLAPNTSTVVNLGTATFIANSANTISASLVEVNGGADACATNNSTSTSGNAAMSGVYTIGGAAGPTNFTTFPLAITALSSRGVCGPVTFNVATGTYSGQFEIGVIPGTSSVNTVTFDGGTAATTILTHSHASTSNRHTVRFSNTNWIRFRNMTIRSTNTQAWPIYIYNNSSEIQIKHCIIECTNTLSLQTTNSYIPVVIVNGTSTSSSANQSNTTAFEMNNIEIDSNVINGGWAGVWVYGNTTAGTNNGIKIRGNTINNVANQGIYSYYITAPTITNNLLNMRVGNGALATSVALDFQNTLSSATTPFILNNNITNNAQQFGVRFNGSGSSAGLQRAQLINNAIGGGFANAASVGISITNSTYIDIYHNSVNIDNAASGIAAAIQFFTSSPTFCDVRNNHFAITNAGASGGLCFRSPASATLSGINHNNYFKQGAVSGTTVAVWLGANQTLANINVNLGAQSVSTSPTFTSATNLLPTSGTINGFKLLSVPTDIAGNIRNNPSDIGAYELPNTNNLDLAVLNITSPDTTLPLGSHDVIAEIYNFGATTVTQFDLKHTVNSLNLKDTVITGINLAQNQSMLVNMGSLKQATFPISQNTLRVFIDNINGGADDDAANDELIIGPRWPAICGTFTIGTGQDFTTFADALTAMANGGICGPIVFNVAAGTYTGQLDIPVINGASATNTIRFVGASMATCSLTFATAASTNNWHVLRFNGCSFVSFEKFTIRSTTTAGWLVHFWNGTNNSIKNCKVEFSVANPTSGNYVPVVINGSNSSLTTTTSIANNHVIDSCQINNGYYGVKVHIANGANKFFVTNSSFNNVYQYAVDVNSAVASKIINNSINMTTPGTTGSIALYFWNASSTTANNPSEIIGNTIINAGIHGMIFQTASGGSSSVTQIYNNMIGGGFRNTSASGIIINSSNYFNIYHNSINMDFNSAVANVGAISANSGSFINIQNNHLAITASSFAGAPLVSNSNTNISLLNNNNYFNNAGANLVISPSGSYTNANFKAAYPTGGGAASLNVNPSFVSNTNLRVTNGCNKGANLNAILPLDIDGTTRSTPADIGAYEVTGLPNNDLGISASINPSFPVTAGSQNIKVVVKNFGSNAVTSANISYSINNGAPVTVAWTGSVQACDTFHFTFPVPITINPYTPYSFKIYTSSPNAASDPTASNDTFSANYCSAMSGVYTIAPMPTPADFASFNDAVNALMCGGIAGPVTFNVSANTFTEKVSIPVISGTSAINTITFNGVNTASTILQYATTSTVNDRSVLQFNNSQFITFRNISIRSTSASYAWTAHFLNGSDNRLVNCVIESPSANPGSSNNYQIILNGDASSASTSSSSANNHQIDSCTIGTSYYGVYSQNNNGLNVTYIRNNTFNQIHQYGIISSSASSALKIIGNTIDMRVIGGPTTSMGIYMQFCSPSSTNFHDISNNIILNAGQYGIYADYSYGSGTTDVNFRGRMFNNMIGGGFRNTSSTVSGIVLRYDRWNVFHNTVNIDIDAALNNSAIDFLQNQSNYDVRNNIFAITATSASSTVPVRSILTGANIFNNNLYFNATNSNLLVTPNGTFTTSNFKAAYPNGGGAASINANPSFVSNTNLRITNACNKGADLTASAPLDIDGSTRSTSPDIGAHEVQGIPSNDIGISALYSPSLPATAGSHVVRAVLKNFGSNTITSADVTYILNNGTPVTQSWSGSLLACDTLHVAFPVPINMVIGNSYSFKLFTSAPNATTDPNSGNDTFNIQVCPALNGTYTIGATGDFANISSAVNTLICGGVSGPVIFNIQTGSYNEQFLLPAISGSSTANSVTFQSLSGNQNDVTISFSSTNSSNNYIANFVGASNIKFKNLTFQANNTSFGVAITINSQSHDDSFFNVRFNGPSTTSGSTNMALFSVPSGNQKFDNWYFGNCIFNNGSYGVYAQVQATSTIASTSVNFTIENSTFTNQRTGGIYSYGFIGLNYLNNTITTNSSVTYRGMNIEFPYASGSIGKVNVIGNRISGAATGVGIYGRYIGINSSGATIPVIANNMIQIGTGATSAYGIQIDNSYNSNYLFNSINVTSTSTASNAAAMYLEGASSGTTTILNNSLVGSNGAASMRWNSSAGFNPVNYNNHYSNNGGTNFLAYVSTTPYTTLPTWRTATSNRDLNSVSVDPLYTSATDLHSNSAGMNNAGTSSALVTTDIDGQTRCPDGSCPGGASILTPDIGADEFEPVALDASISAINAPTAICPGGPAANVLVSLKNIGISTLNSATIEWSVNGVTQTPYNYTTPSLTTGQETNNINIGSFSFVGLNNIIKVWSASPNGSTDGNNTNDTISFSPSAQLNGIYTIGGTTPDFINFSDAVTALNTIGVCGPVTFNVRQGTYNEKLQINAIPGASATNFVTFTADPANTNPVVLTDNTTNGSANNHTVFFNGTSFVQFRDMTINNTSVGSWNSVLRFAGMQDSIVIKKCILNANTTTTNSPNLAVVNHGTGAANMITRFVLDSNIINNGSYGIYLYGNTNTVPGFEANNKIRHNTFNNNYYYGIYTYFQRNHEIIGNTIDMGASTDLNSFAVSMTYIDSFKVERNNIKRFGAYGIYGQILNNQLGSGNYISTINNNMIGGVNFSSSAYGLSIQSSNNRNFDIDHNSVSVNTGTGGYAFYIQASGTNQFQNVNIRNNSFANFGLGQAAYMYVANSLTPAPFVINYNNYYSNAGSGTWYTALQGQSFNGTNPNGGAPTYNSNSKVGDPQYLNNLTNLKSLSSQLHNSGQVLASVTTDIDGDTRCPNGGCPGASANPCIGADEYQIPQFNTGVVAVASPTCPITPGLQNVVLTVQNFGTQTLTSANVSYKVGINGAVKTVAWTGSVSTGNTANVTFTGANQHLFNVTAPDTIYSWTALPNGNADLYTPNDTNISTYAVPLNGTYTVGGASPDFANLTEVAARLNTCGGVTGPVVFNIRSGIYSEQITLSTINGASATNSITFQAETGVATDVDIQFNATTSLTNYVINFAGANYVKFKNLTVTPLNASNGRALVINANSHYDSFFNVRFVGLTTTSSNANLALIGSYTTTIQYDFWCFDNCQFINASYGAYFLSSSSSVASAQNLTIKNSQFTNQYAYGLYNQQLNGLRILNNVITTNSAFTSYMGISNNYIMSSTDDNRTFISGNSISGAVGGHGIYNSQVGVSSGGRRAVVSNNMIQIGSGNNSSYGIRVSNEYGSFYMHNTIRVTSTQSTSASAAIYLENNSTSNPLTHVTRNIFTGTNGAPALFVNDATSGLPRFNPIDSNLLYSSGVNLAFHGATAYSNLSNWQSGVSRDANSISTLPNFISSTNLRISGPKVMPVPVNSLVTTDIDGNARCFITDIGVYHTAENNDIGISQTIIPNGSVAPAGLQDIVVVLQNFGGNTLTSAEVKYTDGIVTRSVNWTGSLGQCDTAHVRFTGANQYNFSGTWNLKFFTSLPNTVTDVNFTNDTLTRSGCVGLLGTYTIGGPIGPTNFTSFNAAISAMSCGIAGPVVFNVAAGTYTGQIDIPAITGASAINTVRFIGSGMASCTLTYATSASVNQYHIVRFNECNFISFEDFTIRSTSSAGWLVHYVNGNNNTLKKSRVEFSVANPSNSNYLPIVISGATNSSNSQSTLATQHVIDSCEVKDGYTGVHIYMNNGNNPIFVSNTNFNNIYQYGIFTSGNCVPKINKNNFAMCITPGTTGAIGMYFSFTTPTGSNFYEINNNKITNAGSGINLYFSSGSQSGYGQIYNNMIGGGFRNSGSRGLSIEYSSRFNVYHNNINIDINTNQLTAASFYKFSSSNLNVRNNHFAITSTGSTAGVPFFSDNASGFDALDFNNYSNASNNNLLSINNTIITTSNYAFAFPTGGGSNSKNFQPQFVSNLDINSGNACAKGTNLNAITPIDINGITRVNPPSIGANEVLGLLSNDIGVVSIINPALPMTNGLQNVKVVIRNFGANTITSANVNYSINNGAVVTAPWTGVMNTCDTIQFTFPVPHNFTGLSTSIKAFSSSPNSVSDALNGNDTTSVTVCPSMAGAYTVGATGDFLSLSEAISTLACGGITAPVTLNIQSGNYTDRSLVPFIPGSSSTNTITIQSLSGNVNDVIISSNAANSTLNYILRFTGGSNFKVRNLTLRTLNASFATVLDIASTSHNDSFFNVKFEGPVVATSNTNQALIACTNSSLKFDYWCFDACQFLNASYGSYMISDGSATASQNFTIKNSTFTNQYAFGINNRNLCGIRMIGNNITTNSPFQDYYGIDNYWIYVANDINRSFITENRISVVTGGFGISNIYLGVNSTVGANRRFLIANNMIQIGSGSVRSIGIYASNERNADYIHNTVNITSANTTSNTAAMLLLSVNSGTSTVLNNNLVSSNGSAAIICNALAGFTPINFNNLYTTGSVLGYVSGTPYFDLSTWQGATSRDINSVSVDPFFVSNTDLHVSQPALDNAGVVSTLVTTDIDGQVRCPNVGCQGPTSFPDIGADEFKPLYWDATITVVKAPKIICPGAGATDVYVSLKNLGQNYITDTEIQWSVDGVAQTPYNWNGYLDQGDVDDSFLIGSYNFISPNSVIKVWNSDLFDYSAIPNADENNANDTLYYSPASRLNGVYTIGGSSPDFASFADAVTVLNTAGVCGPTTFHVRQGTYTEKLQINAIPGASATNFVTFRPDPANTTPVVLTDNSSNSAATNHTVFFNGTSFVEFREMTISNTSSSSWSSVLRFAGTQDSIVIRKNTLSNNIINSSSQNYAVVNHATGAGNMISRFVLDSNTINGGSMGIYLYGSTNTNAAGFEANNRIRHNSFNNHNYYGIFTYFQRNMEIIGNTIDLGATANTSSNGIQLYAIDTFRLERNNILRFGSNGITTQFLNFQFGTGNATSTIVNNMVGGMNSNSSATGIYINPGNNRNINIYHNSVSVNSNQYAIFLQQTSSTHYSNIDVRNNSFANFGTGQAAYMYFSTGTPYSVNYNNYFSNGSTFYTLQTNSFNASQPNGLAPTYNANSKNGDPLYINSMNNLHSIATQLNDAGDNSVGVAIDIDGETRPISPSTTVDIGADEYNIPQFDAGIVAIQSPLGICSGGGSPSNIIVTVSNQGTATLTSATVNWTVNGTPQTPFAWTGSLAQNATESNVNIGSYTFALLDALKVWVSDPNGNPDENIFNDTQSNVMNNQLTGTYTIGGASPDYPNFTTAATALSTVGVCGPVTFNVRQGTYNEKVQINTILGSSATNFVTFRPDPANSTPVILTTAGNTDANNNHTLLLNGASFVQFRNMTINNTSTSSWKSVIRLAGVQDSVVIKNNIITASASTSSGQNEAVINHGTSSFNMINRFVLDSNIINNGSTGVYMVGTSNTIAANYEGSNRIRHNTFNNVYYYSIFTQFQRNLEIIGNTIDMGTLTNTNSIGMYLSDLDTFKIERNNIRRFGYYGIYTQGNMNHQFGSGNATSTIVNNMIGGQNINANATAIWMNAGNTRNVNIYHNSISINSAQYGLFLQTTTPGQYANVNIRNNSFANFGSGVAAYITYLSYAPFNVDYNNYFSAGTNLLTMGWITNYNTPNALAPTYNANSKGGNPIYINNLTDLHSIAGQLNDAGDNTVGVTFDIDGDARPLSPATTVDIGADEYNMPPDNTSVTAIVSPSCPLSAGLQDVIVNVANYGSVTLTSVDVKYKVGINGTVKTEAWTGSLASGSNMNVTFTGVNQHNFTGTSIDTIIAWTESPNGGVDFFTGNDTTSGVFYVPLNGTYTVGGASPDFSSLTQVVEALNCAGVSSPVVFNIRNGVYAVNLDLGQITGSSVTNTVTFKAETGNAADVTINPAGTGTFAIRLTNTKHVVIRNLTIIKTGSGSSLSLISSGADSVFNVVVRNCIFSNSWAGPTAISTSGRTHSLSIIGNTVSNSTGFNIAGNSTVSQYNKNLVLDSNNFLISPQEVLNPIVLSNCNGPKIRANVIARSAGGGAATVTVSNIVGVMIFANNIIHGGQVDGTTFQNINTNGDGIARIHNNFFANNNTSSFAIRIINSKNIDFYHNSLYQHANNSAAVALRVSASSVNNNNIKLVNNNFVTQGSSVPLSIEGSNLTIAQGQIAESNYNNYFSIGGVGTDLMRVFGTGYNSIAALKGQIYSNSDSASINVNPGYAAASASTTNLNLRITLLSPVNNKGKELVSVTNDIDGNPRYAIPDIGASEVVNTVRPVTGDLNNPCVNLSGTDWIDIFDGSGNIIYSINPNGNNLGLTCAGVRILASPDADVRKYLIPRYGFYGFLLDRNYYIRPTTQPTTPVSVRFYFLNSELNDMRDKTVADFYNYETNAFNFLRDSMIITKYSGYVNDLNPTDSLDERNYVRGIPFSRVAHYSKTTAYVEFSTPSFSEFTPSYYPTNTLTPLPISITKFEAVKESNNAIVSWSINKDQPVKHYELERSFDGVNFVTIQKYQSTQSQYENGEHNDKNIGLSHSIVFYRLKVVPQSGQNSYSVIKQVVFTNKTDDVIVYPSPTAGVVNITKLGQDNDITYVNVIDVTGKVLIKHQNSSDQTNISLDIEHLAAGVYFIEVVNDQKSQKFKIIKQ